jgi:hypothetical protein
MAAQDALSFSYDSVLDVVSTDGQVLGIAASGEVTVSRPDKIIATRAGGFADVHMSFDGKTLTILGGKLNVYTQIEAPGSIDQLVDVLRNQYGRPLPAADLLSSNIYDVVIAEAPEAMDLGTGVVGGVECDWLAFRGAEVDLQIWIAQGEEPYPCRYVITSKQVEGNPQYSIQTRDWKTGGAVATTDFSFKNTTGAEKVELEALEGAGEFPDNFTPATGESK